MYSRTTAENRHVFRPFQHCSPWRAYLMDTVLLSEQSWFVLRYKAQV